jgi:hypothetical protein
VTQALDLMATARAAMDSVSNVEHLFGRAKAFLDLCPPIPQLAFPPDAPRKEEEDTREARELKRNARNFAEVYSPHSHFFSHAIATYNAPSHVFFSFFSALYAPLAC